MSRRRRGGAGRRRGRAGGRRASGHILGRAGGSGDAAAREHPALPAAGGGGPHGPRAGSDGDLCPDRAGPALNYPQEEATLNEMFRGVEELMEDTQYRSCAAR